MEKVYTIDPVKDERWDIFVRSHPFGSIFHSSGWSQVLTKTFRYIPRYVVLENDGVIKGAMPLMKIDSWLTGRRLISLPRTSYCDPLIETKADLDTILDFVYHLIKKEGIGFVEIKTQKNADLVSGRGLKCYEYYTNAILDMKEGLDVLWKRFHRSCIRQKITRAQKDGVRVRSGSSMQDVEIFYSLYNLTTKKHEVTPRPYSFIKNIWETFKPKGEVMILIAEVDNKLGAAGLFLKSKDSITFELLGMNYDVIEHSPGHLLAWEAMQRAHEEGLRYFDFGLTPPENTGLLQFKTRWGAKDSWLKYFYYPDVKGYKRFVTHSQATVNKSLVSKLNKWAIMRAFALRFSSHFG